MLPKTETIIQNAEKLAEPLFKKLDGDIALFNQKKVLDAYREFRVAVRHFTPTTGYGYGDEGRDTLGQIFAKVFGAESAIVSPNLLSGTHTLTVALFGLLRPGDLLVSITGSPYDTLTEVIRGKNIGSLADYGIEYEEIALRDGLVDIKAVLEFISTKHPKVIMLTRSRGYSSRDAFSVEYIGEVVKAIRNVDSNVIIFVDNCYGEFVEKREPTEVGVDVIAGSLIKNAGGGIAPTGGYVAGRADLIEQIGYRLTSPSVGTEIGSYFGSYMPFYEGFFLAPSVVANALKGTVLASYALSSLGYEVIPKPGTIPNDIICSVKFNTKEELISFIQKIQFSSPVDSFALPVPCGTPGYDDEIIMAAGTFVQGSSIELSADAPVKAPYIAYLQGGLTYQHFKIALSECIDALIK